MPNPHQNAPQYMGANDNSPAWVMEPRARAAAPNPFQRQKTKSIKPGKFAPLYPLLTVLALTGLFFWEAPTDTLRSAAGLMSFIGLVWAGFCKRVEAWRSREFTLLTVIGAGFLALFGTAALAGISLNTIDMAMIVACLSLAIAVMYKSAPALLTSVFATTLWLFAFIPALNMMFGLGESNSFGWTMLLPILLVGQIILSSKLQNTACLAVSLLASYGWIAWLGVTANIPVTALAGLGFAIGVAHHRIGKSLKDENRFGAAWQSWLGVIAALGAALFLQSIWLNPDMGQAIPGWMPTQIWWAGLGVTTLALFIASLQRYKNSRITLSGIFILSAATLILPIVSIRPDLVRDVFAAIPGLGAAPGFGLIIGAAIMAAGLAWITNGLRRLKLFNVIIGAALVGIQGIVLLAPGRANLDLGIVFICSLIAALCIGGLVAGASLDHSRPARRSS
ncbi:hypothetical protein [Litorimonas sp. WD9-15]|uniref:hypothetical protein n=1 Tax=Litorimonas sp. WD9-15 TaxID=3418716 RepID=UPI003D0296E5